MMKTENPTTTKIINNNFMINYQPLPSVLIMGERPQSTPVARVCVCADNS